MHQNRPQKPRAGTALNARPFMQTVRLSWPVYLNCGLGIEKNSLPCCCQARASLRLPKSCCRASLSRCPRVRLKTVSFSRIEIFQGFELLRAGPSPFSRQKNTNLLIFSEAEQGASPWHCRRGGSPSPAPNTLFRKGVR